jgi:hypothetical protein
MAQPGHLEYERCLAARTPSAGGGRTGLSRFQHRIPQVKCRCPIALIATMMSAKANAHYRREQDDAAPLSDGAFLS